LRRQARNHDHGAFAGEEEVRLLIVWLINTVALLAVSYLMSSVQVDSVGSALVAALVLGLANAIVRPILVLLTLPVTLLTLGLFIFVINGLLFLGVAHLVPGFHVAGLWPAILAAILFSLVSWLLSALLLAPTR
jgi:putative membrane protein